MNLKEIYNALVRLKTIDVVSIDSKLLAAATDYTAEDVMSESATTGTVFSFKDMARKNGGSGVINKAVAFCSKTGLTPRITLYLYNRVPTSINLYDNLANAGPSRTDWPIFVGQIDFLAMEDLGGGSTSVVTTGTYGNLPLPYKCIDRGLYGIAVTRDGITGEEANMLLGFQLQTKQD